MANHSAGDGRTSVNIGSAVPNADGTVTIVVSHGPSAHPNALTTMDYPRGNLAFRWFLADAVPEPPEVLAGEAARTHRPRRSLRRQTMSGALTRASSASWSVSSAWRLPLGLDPAQVVVDLVGDAGRRPSRARRPSARPRPAPQRTPRSKVSMEMRVRRVSTSSRWRAPSWVTA